MATTPRHTVRTLAGTPRLARGADERFPGYGAMGVPYAGGHYLALRDVLASSLGSVYRTIWHRDPQRRWTIFTNTDPDFSCPRYFGSGTAVQRVDAIEVTWRGDWMLDVRMGDRLSWRLVLQATPSTRMMTAMGGATPHWCWDSDVVLASMGPMASGFLRSGRIRLLGHTPNGQRFKAAPFQVWRVGEGDAVLDGVDFGPLGPLAEQTRLGDFWLPQRGLFFAGRAQFRSAAPGLEKKSEMERVR